MPDEREKDANPGGDEPYGTGYIGDENDNDETAKDRGGSVPKRTNSRNGRGTQILRKAGVAAIGVLLAGLVLPAAIKQWSDRTDELSFKKELIIRITEANSDALVSSQCIALSCVPEVHAFQLNPQDTSKVFEANAAQQKAYEGTDQAWQKASFVTDSLLEAYFKGSDVQSQFREFSLSTSAYIRLNGTFDSEYRNRNIDQLERYLPEIPPETWCELRNPTLSGTEKTPENSDQYVVAYLQLIAPMTSRRLDLTRKIVDSNAVGYSSGLNDFIQDLYPFDQ